MTCTRPVLRWTHLVDDTQRLEYDARELFLSLRDRDLAIEGEDPSPATQGYTQNQVLRRARRTDRQGQLFWFGSLQLRRRDDVVPSLSNADAVTLTRFGVSPDSVSVSPSFSRRRG